MREKTEEAVPDKIKEMVHSHGSDVHAEVSPLHLLACNQQHPSVCASAQCTHMVGLHTNLQSHVCMPRMPQLHEPLLPRV